MGRSKISLSFFLMFWIIASYSQILNIESYRIKTDTTGWAGRIGMDVSLTKNTKSLTKIGSKAHVQYKTSKSLILLLGQYNLLVSDGTDLIDKSTLHLRYNYDLTSKITGEYFVQGQKNSISKIDLRALAGAGLRFKLLRKENFRYYLGTTAMYEYEQSVINTIEKLWRWSNYFSFSIYPNKAFSFVSTTYYQPAFKSFGDYRMSSQNALFFNVTGHLSFKTAFNYNYDSTPVSGVPKVQYALSSGLVYNFK